MDCIAVRSPYCRSRESEAVMRLGPPPDDDTFESGGLDRGGRADTLREGVRWISATIEKLSTQISAIQRVFHIIPSLVGKG